MHFHCLGIKTVMIAIDVNMDSSLACPEVGGAKIRTRNDNTSSSLSRHPEQSEGSML
jgi:hypothetical protein